MAKINCEACGCNGGWLFEYFWDEPLNGPEPIWGLCLKCREDYTTLIWLQW